MKEIFEKIVVEHDLINQTFEHFWKAYDCYLSEEDSKEEVEELGLVDRNSVDVEFSGYGFSVSREYDFVHIRVYLDIFRKGESLKLGEYSNHYDLEGEWFDYFFIIL